MWSTTTNIHPFLLRDYSRSRDKQPWHSLNHAPNYGSYKYEKYFPFSDSFLPPIVHPQLFFRTKFQIWLLASATISDKKKRHAKIKVKSGINSYILDQMTFNRILELLELKIVDPDAIPLLS